VALTAKDYTGNIIAENSASSKKTCDLCRYLPEELTCTGIERRQDVNTGLYTFSKVLLFLKKH
jgi:hypothetical protein